MKKFLSIHAIHAMRLLCGAAIATAACSAWGQEPDAAEAKEPKHVLWIIPNNRTSPSLEDYQPIGDSEKLKIAKEDTADRGTVALVAIFAGMNQVENSDRTFGQGTRAY